MRELVAGIDPGVHTGFAIWNRKQRKLVRVDTLQIHEALEVLLANKDAIEVRFEDSRLRKYFGGADARQAKSGAGIREGIGSVKRDCGIIEDFLKAHKIPYLAVKPSAGMTKWTPEHLARLTGWTGRTSNHGRDAAALVVGL